MKMKVFATLNDRLSSNRGLVKTKLNNLGSKVESKGLVSSSKGFKSFEDSLKNSLENKTTDFCQIKFDT